MVRAGSSPILIGREAETERLRAAFDAVERGEGAATVLILGEAGVGKSRLVADCVEQIRARGGRALVGGAMEIDEANLPYVPILEALRSLVTGAVEGRADDLEDLGPARPDLARLFPELGPPPTAGDAPIELTQTRLFGQLLGVLARLGQRRPVALVIEDLQWADRSTRELVGFLARTLKAARVMLVITVRTDSLHARHPLTPFLAELSRVEGVQRMTLDRLTRDEHDRQVAAILGSQPEAEMLAQTFARSDGNPFYTEELIAPDGGSGVALSTNLRDVLLARGPRPARPHAAPAAGGGRRMVTDPSPPRGSGGAAGRCAARLAARSGRPRRPGH